VLGDVGDPELVAVIATELPLHAVCCGHHAGDAPEAGTAGYPLDSSALHQELDRLTTYGDALTEGQLGMDTAHAVRASRRTMRLEDHVGDPRMTDRTRRWGA
jgi:hypothetical protein